MTFQRLSRRYRQEAVKYLIHEEKNGHVRTRTFICMAGFYVSVESLLEMIAKRQNTSAQLSASFH